MAKELELYVQKLDLVEKNKRVVDFFAPPINQERWSYSSMPKISDNSFSTQDLLKKMNLVIMCHIVKLTRK